VNDFPKLGIKTDELRSAVQALIAQAFEMRGDKSQNFGAVNWGDIGVVDIEYRLSMLSPGDGPHCIVLVEEASPDSGLAGWLTERIDREKFPRTYVECEW
jgi:hypothetical protein